MNRYVYVMNNSVNYVDPYGLLTIYEGPGASGFLGGNGGGSATVSAGPIIYSTGHAPLTGLYMTFGSEDSTSVNNRTTFGGGAGSGNSIGFMTGDESAFCGEATNLTIVAGGIGITYTESGDDWGFSISYGGKGYGVGYYIYNTMTNTLFVK